MVTSATRSACREAIWTVALGMPVEQVANLFGITPDEMNAIVQAA